MPPMNEKRAAKRLRTLRSGSIAIEGRPSIDCSIRNLSTTGAQLSVKTNEFIPDRFELFIVREQLTLPATVRWRKGNRLGVHFTGVARVRAIASGNERKVIDIIAEVDPYHQ